MKRKPLIKIIIFLLVIAIVGGLVLVVKVAYQRANQFSLMEESPNISLPPNYTLDNYTIEKILEESCRLSNDCQLPFDYAVQSRCPFVVLCLQEKCTVVCPEAISGV